MADDEVAEMLRRLAAKVTVGPNTPRECQAPAFSVNDNDRAGAEFCDGLAHYESRGQSSRPKMLGRCPVASRRESVDRISFERERLRATIERLDRAGGAGFSGYDTDRHPSALKAYRAMLDFSAAGRPPVGNVLLIGLPGLGKTRLLIASHFALLEAGINSHFVTSAQLRDIFRRAGSFDEDVKREADGQLAQYLAAAAVHVDDLGDVDGDQRFRGMFAEGFKSLLDGARGAFAFSTNCTLEQAEDHPDIGRKLLSRMVDGAVLVPMKGRDRRVERARSGS